MQSLSFWFLKLFSSQRNHKSLRDMSVLGIWQGKYDMGQEHTIVSESMEVLKKQTKTHINWGLSEGCRSQMKEHPMIKAGTIWAMQ